MSDIIKPVDNAEGQAIEHGGDGDALVNTLSRNDTETPDTLKTVTAKMEESSIMPALDTSDLADTVGAVAQAMDQTDISLQGDRDLSSGSAVSTVLKASGAAVEQTMDIGILHDQLGKANWSETSVEDAGELKPGDLIFTGMERQGRNVGIVGTDGRVYSHNFRQDKFVGLNKDQWNSKWKTVMRPPQS